MSQQHPPPNPFLAALQAALPGLNRTVDTALHYGSRAAGLKGKRKKHEPSCKPCAAYGRAFEAQQGAQAHRQRFAPKGG